MTQMTLMPDGQAVDAKTVTPTVGRGAPAAVPRPGETAGKATPLDEERVARTQETVLNFMATEGKRRVAEFVRPITPIRLTTRDGRSTVEYLATPAWPAAFRASAGAGGVLEIAFHGRSMAHAPITCAKCEDGFHDMVGARLMDELVGEFGPDEVGMLAGPTRTNTALVTAAHRVVNEIVAEQTAGSVLPGGMPEPAENERRTLSANRRATVDKLVRTHVLDRETARAARAARRTGNRGSCRAAEYNAALRGEKAVNDRVTNYRRPGYYIGGVDAEAAAEAAAARVLLWRSLAFEKSDTGDPVVVIMDDGCGASVAELRRERDGTLSYRGPSEPQQRLNFNHVDYVGPAIDQAAAHLMAELIRQSANPGHLLYHGSAHEAYRQMRSTAEELMTSRMRPPLMPPGGRTKELAPAKIPYAVTRIARAKVADREILTAVDRVTGRSKKFTWDIHHYNRIALNQQIFDRMQEGERSALRFYLNTIFPAETGDAVRLRGAADIVAKVRARMPMSKGAWRCFVRLNGEWPSERPGPEAMTAACELIHEANRPDADPEYVRAISGMGYEAMRFREESENHPECWRTWVMAANRFLGVTEPFNTQMTRDIHHIADAIRARRDGAWGPATWTQLVARAERTLQEQRQLTRRANGPQSQPELRWESAVGETAIGGFTFSPVTTSTELRHWADRMGNCLGNYDRRCAAGDDRIFVIWSAEVNRGEDGLRGAVQISGMGGKWRAVQTEGPRRGPIGPECEAACRELADMYERADTLNIEE